MLASNEELETCNNLVNVKLLTHFLAGLEFLAIELYLVQGMFSLLVEGAVAVCQVDETLGSAAVVQVHVECEFLSFEVFS